MDGIQHHLHSDSHLNIQSNVHSNMYLNPHFIEKRQVKLESENSFMRKTDQITKVRQKESLRNQAAERLKRMLRKKYIRIKLDIQKKIPYLTQMKKKYSAVIQLYV